MNVAICDEDRKFCRRLSTYIKEWASERNVFIEIVEYESYEQFMFHWSPNQKFDILFLGTQKKGMSGMELARLIRRIDKELELVFIMDTTDYVYDGYTVGVLRYWLKPTQKSDYYKCLDEIHQKAKKKEHTSILIVTESWVYRMPYDQIMYIEASGHYLIIHTEKESLRYRKAVGELLKELPESQFICIHRSYIVNIHYIQFLTSKIVKLENNINLPLSRLRYKEVKSRFVQYNMV